MHIYFDWSTFKLVKLDNSWI